MARPAFGIPAKAGIQGDARVFARSNWTPACAGVTEARGGHGPPLAFDDGRQESREWKKVFAGTIAGNTFAIPVTGAARPR